MSFPLAYCYYVASPQATPNLHFTMKKAGSGLAQGQGIVTMMCLILPQCICSYGRSLGESPTARDGGGGSWTQR